MTDITGSSINPADIFSVLEGMSDMDLEAAKQSHGWSCVMDRTITTVEESGGNWRDVAASVEAWFVAKAPLPDDQTERAVLAAMHGLHDGIVTGRFPMADDTDESAFEAVLKAVTYPVGGWESLPNVPALKMMLELLDGVHVATVAAANGDEDEAWGAIAHAVRWISTHAYHVGGDDLCTGLAEAVRMAAPASTKGAPVTSTPLAVGDHVEDTGTAPGEFACGVVEAIEGSRVRVAWCACSACEPFPPGSLVTWCDADTVRPVDRKAVKS